MDPVRIHRATSADGTQIASSVHGRGPAIVLVPGGPSDGETGWQRLLPTLTDDFTVFPVNTRGRGLSADHPDHSRERIVEDIVSYVESIGEPVLLFGHSAGGTHALEAAAHTTAVRSLALYEPTLTELGGADLLARFTSAFARVRRAVEEGRPADGAWIFLEELAMVTDEERAALTAAGAAAGMAHLMDVVLVEEAHSGLPQLSDLALLDRVRMPVLLLHGASTNAFYIQVADHLRARLADCRARAIPGLGHLGPEIAPEPVAAALVELRQELAAGVSGGSV